VLFALLVLCVLLFVVIPVFATIGQAIVAVVVGLVLGFLARAVAPGRGSIGLVLTALVGIAGGLIGRIVARALHYNGQIGRFLLEVLAASVLVIAVRTFQGTNA
jgi:uncharacterized membrane protein YeaQ/YmgE (transglycosylase-associated protein family)